MQSNAQALSSKVQNDERATITHQRKIQFAFLPPHEVPVATAKNAVQVGDAYNSGRQTFSHPLLIQKTIPIPDTKQHRLWLCLAGSLMIHVFFLFSSPYKSIHMESAAMARLRANIVKKHVQQFHVSKSTTQEPLTKEKPATMPPPATPPAPTTPEDVPWEDYVDPDTVDQKASAIDVPELPPPTDSETAPGLLRIKVFINSSGQPDYVEVLETTLPEDYVIVLSDIFRQAKFSPALQGEKAINSWRIIEILYGEPETAETPAPAR